MKKVFELLVIVAVGALVIIAGVNYASRNRKASVSTSHEETVPAPTSQTSAADVADSTPTAIAPVTNEEDATPATPEQPQAPKEPTFTVHCYAGNNEVYGLEKVTEDTMERDGDRWEFTKVDGNKTVYFTGTCLITQD